MAWVVPTLIVAGAAAAAAGIAHDVQALVKGQTPWDNPADWVKGHYTAGGLGFAGGFLGGAAGAALGPALGTAGGTMTGVVAGSSSTAPGVAGGVSGSVGGGVSGSVGGVATDAASSTLASAASIIGEGAGTIPAEAGAVTPSSIAGIIPKEAGSILAGGTKGSLSSMLQSVGRVAANAGVNAGTGALGDMENPGRGALVGAAGSVASSGLNFAGQATGIIPRVDTSANYQPIGNTGGYSPDTASIMPPKPGYTSSGFGPSLGTRAMGAAGRLGVKAGTMGVQQYVGNAMTPPPPGQPMGTYQSFGIQPYFEKAPYA